MHHKRSNKMHRYNILLILLLVSACVEHKFSFHISPDGSYKVHYSAHGDKMDLQDHDFPMPFGVKWDIHSTMEQIEAESYDYTAHRLFKRNEKIPETFFMGDSIYSGSLLKHPTGVKHSNWFFWETFVFNGKFFSKKTSGKSSINQSHFNLEIISTFSFLVSAKKIFFF